MAKGAAVQIQSRASALGLKIPLIPIAALLRRVLRLSRSGDVLDIVAVDGKEAAHALGPQRGDNTSGAPTPIVSRENRTFDGERINHLKQVVAECRLLAGARRLGGQKSRWPEAAQIGHE